MAEDVSELFGDALLDVARDVCGRVGPRARKAIDWVREAAEPPPGIELRAPDGATYTGFAVLDHSRVVVLLAVRQEAERTSVRPPIVTPPPSPVYHRPLFDPELDGRWDRDGDPFRR